MKNIGIVCEGPTDYILLKGIIDKISGKDNQYFQLQSEDNLLGEYGNGWKGVWKWCLDHRQGLEKFMNDIEPKLDILVVHMDGDVARKEKEVHCGCRSTECKWIEEKEPLSCQRLKNKECPVSLPCKSHPLSAKGYRDHLTAKIEEWLGFPEKICIVVPCDSTEAWVIAAYDKYEESEEIKDPWNKIISKGKSYHNIRIPGHKKNTRIYQQFVLQVCNNWEAVKRLCTSAEIFEKN